MSYYFQDVCGLAGSGTLTQNISDVVCLSPKAANQFSVMRTDHRLSADSGAYDSFRYGRRFLNNPTVNN
jgi:hypothetical protein